MQFFWKATVVKKLLFIFLVSALMAPAMAQQTPTPSATPAAFDPAATPIPALPATPVLVGGGTSVEVSLSESVSSNTANVGDIVPITVDKEVDASGFVVIPKGANGEATVTLVDHAGGNGHGGKLGLTMNWVYSADHGKILLSNVNHAAGAGSSKKGASSTATILTYVLLGPLGLFAHNFVRGKDVTISTTKDFHVFVDHDVHVEATQKATTSAGFDN